MIVTPAWRFGVSRRINKRFENRRVDYAMHGRKLKVPNDVGPQPDFNKAPHPIPPPPSRNSTTGGVFTQPGSDSEGWAAHRNDRRGMTTGRWWRCSSFNGVGPRRRATPRQDRPRRRQQLREHLEVVPPSGREGQRCVHVDADHVAARRGAQLALAGEQNVPGLAAIQRVTGLPPCASLRETMSFSSSRVGAAIERNAPLIWVGTPCMFALPCRNDAAGVAACSRASRPASGIACRAGWRSSACPWCRPGRSRTDRRTVS